jgi:hypothetical protein
MRQAGSCRRIVTGYVSFGDSGCFWWFGMFLSVGGRWDIEIIRYKRIDTPPCGW